MDERQAVAAAVAATVSGDAIGNLTPLSLIVSEPAKAMYLRDRVPGSRAFPALAAENFFYSVSVALYIILGTIAMLQEFPVPPELRLAGALSIGLMAVVSPVPLDRLARARALQRHPEAHPDPRRGEPARPRPSIRVEHLRIFAATSARSVSCSRAKRRSIVSFAERR